MSRSTFFFDKYPHFQQDPLAPINDEFERLAQIQGWRKKQTEWRIQRGECLQAEFEFHLGSIEVDGKLAAWRNLCLELGIGLNKLTSITECKKELRGVHVNLLDLIDARRAHEKPRLFRTASALANYTRNYKRYFPLDEAKEDSLKRILLRNILSPGHR
ncbi:MAG: hypothetical protein Q9221_004033 [Calogaya cf. arnoldii]